ncbi:MAG: hypothetical protein M3163_01815 [Actinomycetota bacterium]|nr:hypothetical protein [Actinomycetota bacterium]
MMWAHIVGPPLPAGGVAQGGGATVGLGGSTRVIGPRPQITATARASASPLFAPVAEV